VATAKAPTHSGSARAGGASIATANSHRCTPLTNQERVCQPTESRTPRADTRPVGAGRRSSRSTSAAARSTSPGQTTTTAVTAAATASQATLAPSTGTPTSRPTVSPVSTTRLVDSAQVLARRPKVTPLVWATFTVASRPGTLPGTYFDKKPTSQIRTRPAL